MNTEEMNTEEMNTEEMNMDEILQLETQNRFKNPWSKLDKGTKLNRIGLFVKKEKIKNELSDKQEAELKELLFRIIYSGELNKISEITYSIEDLEITEIKNLLYDSKTKKYSYNNAKKKKKPETSKSKSNIDRHFSRSKEKK